MRIRILHSGSVCECSAWDNFFTMTAMDEHNLTDHLNAEKERITVFQLETYKLVALVIWLMILLLVQIASNSAIIRYVIFYAQRRPLNTMMLIHQICQLLTSTTLTSMTIFFLIRRTPILEDFGPIGCYVIACALVLYNLSFSLGGFGMAVYRIVCFSNRFTPASQAFKFSKRASIIILLSEGLLVLVLTPITTFCILKESTFNCSRLFATDQGNMAIR